MYNLLVKFIYLLSFIPFIFPPKYQRWFLEQAKIFNQIKKNKEKTIWIHCSSLGEYESIKPLISELKNINTNITITFFSESGYVNFQDFQLINQISYLPIDLYSKMKLFIEFINPEMVLISKNDVWPNMTNALIKKNIPMYLVGCQINKNKVKHWIAKKYYIKYYSRFLHIFCHDQFTIDFLNKNKILNTSIIGNTRINQIITDAEKHFENEILNNFTKKKTTIIYGSVEKSDYKIIMDSIKSKKNINHIIIPHEINIKIIKELKDLIGRKSILYSQLTKKIIVNHNIIIVDKFGILKNLYRYSKIAYIGGGFNNGIHNILEPAIHGNLMLYGPNYKNFSEASFFIKKHIAYSIKNKMEFEQKLYKFTHNTDSINSILNTSLSYFKKNKQDIQNIIQIIKSSKTII